MNHPFRGLYPRHRTTRQHGSRGRRDTSPSPPRRSGRRGVTPPLNRSPSPPLRSGAPLNRSPSPPGGSPDVAPPLLPSASPPRVSGRRGVFPPSHRRSPPVSPLTDSGTEFRGKYLSDDFVRIGKLLDSFALSFARQEEATEDMIDSFKKIARLPVTTVGQLRVVRKLKMKYGFDGTVIVFKQLPNSEELLTEGTRQRLAPVLMTSIFRKADASMDSLRQRLTATFPQ